MDAHETVGLPFVLTTRFVGGLAGTLFTNEASAHSPTTSLLLYVLTLHLYVPASLIVVEVFVVDYTRIGWNHVFFKNMVVGNGFSCHHTLYCWSKKNQI